jgi:ubiquinone biosynthesis accessory factor UbiK
MLNSGPLLELSNKIKELINNSPAGDLDRNIHALIQGALTKMELISREEYDVQTEVLKHTREKLDALEEKLRTIEDLLQKSHK